MATNRSVWNIINGIFESARGDLDDILAKMGVPLTGSWTDLIFSGKTSIQTTSIEALKVGDGTADVLIVDTINKRIATNNVLAAKHDYAIGSIVNDTDFFFLNASNNGYCSTIEVLAVQRSNPSIFIKAIVSVRNASGTVITPTTTILASGGGAGITYTIIAGSGINIKLTGFTQVADGRLTVTGFYTSVALSGLL